MTLGPYCLPVRGLELQPALFLLLPGPGTKVSIPKRACPAHRPLPPYPTLGFLNFSSSLVQQLLQNNWGLGSSSPLAPPWAVSNTRLMTTAEPKTLCLATSGLCPGPGFQDQDPSTQSQDMVRYAWSPCSASQPKYQFP